jgi:hypothetical protein
MALTTLTTIVDGSPVDHIYVATSAGIHRWSASRLEPIVGHVETNPLVVTGPVAANDSHVFAIDNGRQQLLRINRKTSFKEVFGRFRSRVFHCAEPVDGSHRQHVVHHGQPQGSTP